MVVYKRNGEDTSIPKVEKPVITPVSVNRDDQTDFLINLSEEIVKDIEPVFLNFDEDIKISSVGDVELLYKENIENERFRLNYVIDIGTNHDNRLKLATDYLKFLGTYELSPEVQQEFYKLGCEVSFQCGNDKTQAFFKWFAVKF